MQKPNKAYRIVRKNQKWTERNRAAIQAFWIANVIGGLAILIYALLK